MAFAAAVRFDPAAAGLHAQNVVRSSEAVQSAPPCRLREEQQPHPVQLSSRQKSRFLALRFASLFSRRPEILPVDSLFRYNLRLCRFRCQCFFSPILFLTQKFIALRFLWRSLVPQTTHLLKQRQIKASSLGCNHISMPSIFWVGYNAPNFSDHQNLKI